MHFDKIHISERTSQFNRRAEAAANWWVRRIDGAKERFRLSGRAADYDDEAFEFRGGARDSLRRKHYDKSLRLMWKAEREAPWLGFADATRAERQLEEMALHAMTDEEREQRRRLTLPEFKELLDREYTRREKEAIVAVLAAIGHGEAYAWLVSASLLQEVKSTGARAALTMQVMEEAKHFVVIRELLRAFDVPIPRQSAWEYMFLESVMKSDGLEKLFGMNVAVEGIALSLFGLLSEMPGLEVLRLIHLDESRHTALPANYFKEFPMSEWQKRNPAARMRRLKIILPALLLIPYLEDDLAELGIDAFEFGGSVLAKVTYLAERVGFHLPISRSALLLILNKLFNTYCEITREGHEERAFVKADTTTGVRERAVEQEVFYDAPVMA